MGKIKKILENELVGGTQTTDVYPVTSIKAVYDENNERLDHILSRRGTVNVSTNYNDDHIAEVLTLSQAIDKVPSSDRVLGFIMTFLSSNGWETYQFVGDSISKWSDVENWRAQAEYIISHEFGSNDDEVVDQANISEALSNSNGFWYKGTIRDMDIRLLECIVDYKIYYNNSELENIPFKLLQTGFSTNPGYETEVLFYAISNEGTIYNFYSTETDKTGIKKYVSSIGNYTAIMILNWDLYNTYFDNRYSAPNNDAGGSGIYVLSQYDTLGILDSKFNTFSSDYSASHLFMRNSYIRQQERNFFECIHELSISTSTGGDIFKILQIGRSVTSLGNTVFNVREISTGTVYYFGVEETVYSGVKSYNNENNDAKIRFRITLDWDKLLSYFTNYYSPVNVETVTDGLFIQASTNNLDKIESLNEESNAINQFNGRNQIGSNERKILQCLLLYKVVTLDKPYEFKIFQTGFSSTQNEALFYMGLVSNDEIVENLNIVPHEEAVSVNELSGIKRYDTEYNSHTIGKIIQTVVIDWDKYKELFANRYIPASAVEYGGDRICVVSDVHNNISELENNLSLAINNVENKDITISSPTTLTEYFRNGYVVCNVPFERDGILNSINVNIFKHEYSTMQLTLLIGTIDQRNWLINPRTYSYSFSELGIPENYSNTNLTIDLSSKEIRINKGEVICLFSRRHTDSSDGKSFLIARNDNDAENVLFSTTLDGVFTPYKEFARFSYSVTYFDTDFAYKDTVSELENNISELENKVNSILILTDLSTGDKYKIVANNGTIQLKAIDYSKGLFIGSSFVNHGISENVGWFRNGAMAPSINDHSLPNLVFASLKAKKQSFVGNIMSSIAWERNYNTTFDFDTDWKPTLQSENPDVIFMHISGNSTWTEEFEAACELMIENVKKTCPLADVFIAASWYGGQKTADMRQACFNKGAIYVDLSTYKVSTSMWGTGDWYYSEDDSQYHGIYQAVITHPNDIGCLLQANAFLRSCGYDEIQGTHTITINANSGIIASTPNTTWLKDGIVTIRIESGNVTQFTVTKASGGIVEATLRTNELNENYNTYYTFVMPDDDVVVNIK